MLPASLVDQAARTASPRRPPFRRSVLTIKQAQREAASELYVLARYAEEGAARHAGRRSAAAPRWRRARCRAPGGRGARRAGGRTTAPHSSSPCRWPCSSASSPVAAQVAITANTIVNPHRTARRASIRLAGCSRRSICGRTGSQGAERATPAQPRLQDRPGSRRLRLWPRPGPGRGAAARAGACRGRPRASRAGPLRAAARLSGMSKGGGAAGEQPQPRTTIGSAFARPAGSPSPIASKAGCRGAANRASAAKISVATIMPPGTLSGRLPACRSARRAGSIRRSLVEHDPEIEDDDVARLRRSKPFGQPTKQVERGRHVVADDGAPALEGVSAPVVRDHDRACALEARPARPLRRQTRMTGRNGAACCSARGTRPAVPGATDSRRHQPPDLPPPLSPPPSPCRRSSSVARRHGPRARASPRKRVGGKQGEARLARSGTPPPKRRRARASRSCRTGRWSPRLPGQGSCLEAGEPHCPAFAVAGRPQHGL